MLNRIRNGVRKNAAALWTVLILALCSIPGSELPEVNVVGFDKVGHLVIFAVFGWLWMRRGEQRVVARGMTVIGLGLVYAIATEVYQGLMPLGRIPDPYDVIANGVGLLVGVGFAAARMR